VKLAWEVLNCFVDSPFASQLIVIFLQHSRKRKQIKCLLKWQWAKAALH